MGTKCNRLKIDAISDLHGHYPKLEGGDLLIIAGDLTARDQVKEYMSFLRWFNSQNYRKKILIAGNHDNGFVGPWGDAKGPFRENKTFYDFDYLLDSGTKFEGLKIWGTPWTKTFPGINPKCCAFTVDRESELQEKFDLIPNDIDILISHGPPFMILDEVDPAGDGTMFPTGSQMLRMALDRVRPKVLICGHIHEQGGKSLMYKHQGPNTMCYNVSYVNEYYKPVNKVTRIEL